MKTIELYLAYLKASVALDKRLMKLKNAGSECNCDDVKDTFLRVHQGEFTEYHEICVKCGGYLINSEL
jgi:hypothetical protein